MGLLDLVSTRPQVEVLLSSDSPSKSSTIPSYTTYDTISGHAIFRSPIPLSFSEVQIVLTGDTKTYNVNHLTSAGANHSTASHVFLRLTMPIPASAYRDSYALLPDRPRSFPFHFIVPDQLLPTACSHEIKAPHVHAAHIHLPPSMGEPLLPLDDLAPEMSKISYAITAKLVQRGPLASSPPQVIAEAQRKLHIIPAIPEAPPLHIAPNVSSPWTFEKTKTLRKGVFAGPLGLLTVSTTQPRALQLSPSSPHASTAALLSLRFEPASPGSAPPRLGLLTAKITATTFHTIRAARDIPDEQTRASPYEVYSGTYAMTVPLASRCVEGAKWTWHVPAPAYERRDSGYDTASVSSGSGSGSGSASSISSSSLSSDKKRVLGAGKGERGWYEASIPVPVTLPTTKTWLPTFHSCLASRFYALGLEIAVHTPGTGVPATSVSLKVPVQIAAVAREGTREQFLAGAAAVGGVALAAAVGGVREEEGEGEEEGETSRLLGIEEGVDQLFLERGMGAGRGGRGSGEALPGYMRGR